MKNILLTGGGGFVGSHLKASLSGSGEYNLFAPRSYELNLLDKERVNDYVEKNSINFIIHSAARGVRIIPNATLEEVAVPNFKMFMNLADLDIPMISIGSGAEYDKSQSLINVKESCFSKRVPKDPYGYSKYLISKEIQERENILNLRLFGVYGFGESPSRVTSCIIRDNLSHEPISLNRNVRFHFLCIDDFCRIVRYFIEHKSNEKFLNVTPCESVEIVELAKIVNDISDYKSEIIVKESGLGKEYTGDNSLLLKEMGGFDFTSYKVGMEKFYRQLKILHGKGL